MSRSDGNDPAAPEVPIPLPPLELRDPLPPVIDDDDALARYCAHVSIGEGPVALDAERASGYRYSQRAYLVQVRREGAGTALIDPIAFGGLAELDEAIGASEWILHAATQDLPCLAEVGLRPRRLFDTELAGRLLNFPRVGLATLIEHYLGRSMAKEHSAADWSTRPLPDSWLHYAALDVEALIELRAGVSADLEAAGKHEWAEQEFRALLDFTPAPRRAEPWRRTSGMHRARGARALAVVRELWWTRDEIAADLDIAPGRVLPDASIAELASSPPENRSALRSLRIMRHRGARPHIDRWFEAISTARELPETELPRRQPRPDGPPPPRAWADRHPAAAARLSAAREEVTALAERHDLPAENLISPQVVRALAWEPPSPVTPAAVAERLAAEGVRPWQRDLVAGPLADALAG